MNHVDPKTRSGRWVRLLEAGPAGPVSGSGTVVIQSPLVLLGRISTRAVKHSLVQGQLVNDYSQQFCMYLSVCVCVCLCVFVSACLGVWGGLM